MDPKGYKLAERSGRKKIAEQKIGSILAFSPRSANGNWPCSEVCQILQTLASEEVEVGLCIGVCNKRGCHTRGRGGDQDRQLAKKFQKFAAALALEFTRTKRVLDELISTYQKEADIEDQQAEIEEFDLF